MSALSTLYSVVGEAVVWVIVASLPFAVARYLMHGWARRVMQEPPQAPCAGPPFHVDDEFIVRAHMADLDGELARLMDGDEAA